MQVTPFDFNSHEIRTFTIDGNPWFIAKDVATALGYSNPRKAVTDHCKRAETLVIFTRGNVSLPLLDSQTKIIPESDVYRLTMRSKLEGAEAFQEWIVEEVLPTIRKTGAYSLKTAAHEVQNSIADLAMEALNLSESGKIGVLQRLCASNGVDASFLPKYSESEQEVSGMLNFALEGLQRLRARGHFDEPEQCMAAFLTDCLDYSGNRDDKVGFLKEVYEKHYLAWCDNNGIESSLVLTVRSFSAKLRDKGYIVRRGTGGQRVVCGGKLHRML